MKRISTITMMLLITGLTNAQQISNAGFESWDTLGDYTQPSFWYSLNPLTEFGFDQNTTLTTDAHSGNYAVRLESISNPFADISGVLCTGPILDDQKQPDFDHMKIGFSGKPTKFEFYYKADPEPGDSAVISMVLTHWNTALQQADTVATASMFFPDSTAAYMHASIQFEYNSPLPPDSMFVIASSSADGFNPMVGSSLTLDDILLVYGPTGISETAPRPEAVLYPNPAQDLLNIRMQQQFSGNVSVYDLLGNKVYNETVAGKDISINTISMNNGLYFVVLQTEEGATQTYKVAVKK
jgi:hypothetical protein